MNRQKTTNNHATYVEKRLVEEDLTIKFLELAERQSYCDTKEGKLRNDVCSYHEEIRFEFMFDYVSRKGQLLDIAGVATKASDTILKSDKDRDFSENASIYFVDGSSGKIITSDPKFLNQKNNRRSSYVPKMWYMTVS